MAITLRAGSRTDFAHVDATPGQAGEACIATAARSQAIPHPGNIAPLEPTALAGWVELLARMSHDLRTPLTAVIGFSDAMQNEMFGPLGHSRYQEYARHIRTSGDLLLKAAEDTLAMTSLLTAPKAATLADVGLAGPLRHALDEIGDRARQRGIVIETIGLEAGGLEADQGDALRVRADAGLLAGARRHLLTAALAHCDSVPGAAPVGVSSGSMAPSHVDAMVDHAARIVVAVHSEHGRIKVTIEARGAHEEVAGALPVTTASRSGRGLRGRTEPGLGHEHMSVWLARLLLEQQHCRLVTTPTHGIGGITLTADFEQAVQNDFFTEADGGAHRTKAPCGASIAG